MRAISVVNLLLLVVGVMVVSPAPVLAGETVLQSRPSDPVEYEQVEMFSDLADQVGWGTLRQTEHMKLANSAYDAGSIMAVTGVPYFPLTFYLQSRDWAFQRLLGPAEADAHLQEIYVEPSAGIQFDILVISETPEILQSASPTVTFIEGSGREWAPTHLDLSVAEEPTLGGQLFSGRGTVLVPLAEDFRWEDAEGFSLRFELGDAQRTLNWRFAD
jgi:hypothetical protein